jgi:isopentenyldiphosphate isomerase
MSEAEEILDLVNEHDEVIGTIARGDYDRMVSEKLGYIRAIDMFIQNDKGQLWVPRRTAHKTIAPNGLDYSTGGHVDSGETYIQAALREISEELNLKLTEADLTFIKKYPPADIAYFRELYIYHSNETPDYNPDDFTEAFWLTPEELLMRLDAGDASKWTIRESVLDLMRFNS